MKVSQIALVFILAILTLPLTQCTTTKYYKTSEVADRFANTLNKVNSQLAEAEADFKEKSFVYKHVTQQTEPSHVEAVPKLTTHINKMKALQAKIKSKKAQLSDLNGQLSALTYKQDKVYSTDPDWKKIDSLVSEFTATTEQLNQLFDRYAGISSDFAVIVSDNRLYHESRTKDVVKKFQETIRTTEQILENMNEVIDRNQDSYKKVMRSTPAAEAVPYKPLREQLDVQLEQREQTEQAHKELIEARNELIEIFKKQKTIKSSDEHWKDFLRLKRSYEMARSQTERANKKFKKAAERFLNISKTID